MILNGSGYGNGYGNGNGYVYGSGYGDGNGSGYGSGYGNGNGNTYKVVASTTDFDLLCWYVETRVSNPKER